MEHALSNWEKRTYLDIVWPEQQVMPQPCREIARGEFERWMYAPESTIEGIYYASIFLEPDKTLWAVHFYWYCQYGLAVAHRYVPMYLKCRPELGLGVQSDSYAMRFFRVGCEHGDLVETSMRMFEHVYRCPDCGLTYSTDSSG